MITKIIKAQLAKPYKNLVDLISNNQSKLLKNEIGDDMLILSEIAAKVIRGNAAGINQTKTIEFLKYMTLPLLTEWKEHLADGHSDIVNRDKIYSGQIKEFDGVTYKMMAYYEEVDGNKIPEVLAEKDGEFWFKATWSSDSFKVWARSEDLVINIESGNEDLLVGLSLAEIEEMNKISSFF
tara:strand:+ start:29352 stop:29894 length:543 start_codon:yes stop_codon:yes gene_type:complete